MSELTPGAEPQAVTAGPAAPAHAPTHKSLPRECCEALIVALILTLFLRAFVVQAFQIPSVSMEPSLLVGDRLFVDKVVYSPSLGPLEAALLGKRPVARGDMVVFKFPGNPARNFVKRVVALPGETVEVRGRVVVVDGRPLDEPYARFGPELPAGHPNVVVEGSGAQAQGAESPRGPSAGIHSRREPPDDMLLGERSREPWGPRVVPDGHVFVLGDNRDRSNDSRYWGFLALDQVEGRPLVVYWSTDADAPPLLAAAGLGRPRWGRLFHAVR